MSIEHKVTMSNGPIMLALEKEEVGLLLSEWSQLRLKKVEGQPLYRILLCFHQVVDTNNERHGSAKAELPPTQENGPKLKNQKKAIQASTSNIRFAKQPIVIKKEYKDVKDEDMSEVKLERGIKKEPELDILLDNWSIDEESTSTFGSWDSPVPIWKASAFPQTLFESGWRSKGSKVNSVPDEKRPVTPPISRPLTTIRSPPSPLATRPPPKRQNVRQLSSNYELSANLAATLSKPRSRSQLSPSSFADH